jgi:hypothetical protein
VLVLMAQFGVGDHPGRTNLLVPLFVLVATACIGRALLWILARVVPRARHALRSVRSRRRRLKAAAGAERRARALMDELCPYGWDAQITLHRDKVSLDWSEFAEGGERTAVTRRVWAPTIHDALDAMVADRYTDETLQQIEQGALPDGASWPEG